MTVPKVGDVVAWDDVPSGALVRVAANPDFGYHEGAHSLRRGDRGVWVQDEVRWSCWPDEPQWEWGGAVDAGCVGEDPTIVALNLTGQETAADLQRLAEVFEVREAMTARLGADGWKVALGPVPVMEINSGSTRDAALEVAAHYLHALGWRKGQTAEDAARLLAEAAK